PLPSLLAGAVAAAFAVTLAWPQAAAARAFTLSELLDMARKSNPGLAAGAQQTAGIEAQLSEARWSKMPSGELLSLLAPAPEILCQPDINQDPKSFSKQFREENCVRTNISEASINIKGVFTRTE